jgi:hypothetical protein
VESAITTQPVSPPPAEVLAEVTYALCEEDYVAYWMSGWEERWIQAYPFPQRDLGSWSRRLMRYALTIVAIMVIASAISGERSSSYMFETTSLTFCAMVGLGLAFWFIFGPRGLCQRLAQARYHRRIRRTAREMAERRTEINLNRVHHLLFTTNACIHRIELDEVDTGSRKTERVESATPWNFFERIERAEHHAFLIEKRNYTHILPCRAFPDEAAFERFVALAERLRQDAAHVGDKRTEKRSSEERITTTNDQITSAIQQ